MTYSEIDLCLVVSAGSKELQELKQLTTGKPVPYPRLVTVRELRLVAPPLDRSGDNSLRGPYS